MQIVLCPQNAEVITNTEQFEDLDRVEDYLVNQSIEIVGEWEIAWQREFHIAYSVFITLQNGREATCLAW